MKKSADNNRKNSNSSGAPFAKRNSSAAPFVKPHFVLIAAAAAVLLIDGRSAHGQPYG